MQMTEVIVAGVLFPESILRGRWFFLLSALVGFNTIVYVGLSFGKIVAWPRQLSTKSIEDLRTTFAQDREPHS